MRFLASIGIPLYILDQVTKWLIVQNFELRGAMEEVISGFFWLHYIDNTGIAFGNFNGGKYSNYIFGAIAFGALLFIAHLWRSKAFPSWRGRWAVALLIPGILGNLTDRFAYGHVVDFLRFDLGFMIWPSFNVADSCICIAACLLFLSAFEKEPEKTPADETA